MESGRQQATAVEVGGGLRSYTLDGIDVLDGYRLEERCTGARGQWLIPWPNRLRDGSYHFSGHSHQLPLSEPGRWNAIHGLVRWSNWAAVEQGPDRVVLEHLLHPQPGYPFTLATSVEYRLSADGLTTSVTATNAGDSPLPLGIGAHPYLRLGTGLVDDLVLRAPGATRMETDERLIPVGTQPVEHTQYDFRAGRPVGRTVLDTGYCDLERDEQGRAWVDLTSADGSGGVRLWMSAEFGYVMLFTGDTLEQTDKRRTGLGVEPMTCPPNALSTGDDVAVLEPGQTFSAGWGILPRAAG